MSGRWLDSVLDFALRPLCVRCRGAAGPGLLCAPCRASLPWIDAACRRCALPLAHPDQGLCRRCARSPPPQQAACAAWRYEAPVSAWIRALKFQRRLEFLPELARGLARAAARCERPDLLVPVPLHRDRLRERGFDQALLLARAAARRLELRCAPDVARRTRPTPAQSLAESRARRLRNLRGAFAATGRLDGLHLAIVDDVVTTGATTEELARTLLRSGAARVQVWSVARTP